MKSTIKKHPLHLPIKESSVVHNDCKNARIKNSIFKASQLLPRVRINFALVTTVISSCIAGLIGKLLQSANHVKFSSLSRNFALVGVACVWSLFLAINSSGFAQTPPTVSIFVPTTNNQAKTITEGEEIAVTIQSTTATTTSLDVTIKIEETSAGTPAPNILDNSLQNDAEIITIPAGMSSYTYTINSQQDTSSGINGEVVISLVASSANPVTYNLINTAADQKVTYTVNNLEQTISIYESTTALQTATIKEGESISVTIQRTVRALTPLDVTIMIDETSASSTNVLDDNLESFAKTVTIPANMTSLVYAIDSQQDTSSTSDGTVVITLVAPTGSPVTYVIPSAAENKLVTFTVTNFAGPKVSIVASAGIVISGNNAVFTVARQTSSSSALTVVVTITATQGYLPDGTGTCSNNVCTIDRNVAIPANMTSQTHNETTKAVSSAQEGIITATIKVDQNYVFGATNNNASTRIFGTSKLRTASIEKVANGDSFVEGEDIRFVLKNDISEGSGIVSVLFEYSGDAMVTGGASTTCPPHSSATCRKTSFRLVAFGNAQEAEVTVSTGVNDTGFSQGEVKISIIVGSAYDVDPNKDSITVTITNKIPRVISISKPATPTSINEGEDFQVTLTSTPAPTTAEGDLSVMISEATPNFGFFNSITPHPVVIGTSGMATATVSTKLLPSASGGTLTLEVGSDTTNTDNNKRYVASSSDGSVSMTIDNVPIPVISLTSTVDNGSVEEGGNIDLLFTATPKANPDGPITVNIEAEVEDAHSDYFSSLPGPTVIIPASSTTTQTLMSLISTNIVNSIDEVGSITITVTDYVGSNAVPDYVVSESDPSITVTITKFIPEISIFSPVDQQTIREGDEFTFTLTSVPPPRSEIEVNLYIFDNDSGFFNELSHDSENIAPAESVAVVNLDTSGTTVFKISTMEFPDSVQEDNSISVTVQDSTATPVKYTPSTSDNSILVNIVDSTAEVDSIISVFTPSREIEIGQSVMVQITANPRPLGPIENVGLLVQTEGNLNLWRVPPPEVTLVDGSYSFRVHPTSFSGESEDDPKITITLEIAKSDDDLVALFNPEAGEEDDVVETSIYEISVTVPPPSDEPPARISVADVAVTAILANVTGTSTSVSAPTEFATANLPEVSVHASQKTIVEGQIAEFLILSHVSTSANVSIAIVETGDFILGNHPESVSFNANHEVRLAIATEDDQFAEQDGGIRLTISEGEGYLVNKNNNSAGIIVSDKEDRKQREDSIIAGLTNVFSESITTLGTQSLNSVSNRVDMVYNENTDSNLILGGQNSFSGIVSTAGDSVNSDSISLRTILDQSSFEVELVPTSVTGVSSTLWGSGDYWNLASDGKISGKQPWTGDIFTGYVGLDTVINQDFLVGMSALISVSAVDYDLNSEDSIQFQSKSAGIHPYLGWQSADERMRLNATAGYGQGEIRVDQLHYSPEYFASSYYFSGADGKFRIFENSDTEDGDISQLILLGSAWIAQQSIDEIYSRDISIDAHQIRIVLEGSHTNHLVSGSTVTPNVIIGFRGKGDTRLSTKVAEIGGSVKYQTLFGLILNGKSEVLIAEQNQVEGALVNGSVKYDNGGDQLGLQIAISPLWETKRNNSVSWDMQSIIDIDIQSNSNNQNAKLKSEIGYGFDILGQRGKLTPFAGYDFFTGNREKLSTGIRMSIGTNLNLGIIGSQMTIPASNSENHLGLDLSYKW